MQCGLHLLVHVIDKIEVEVQWTAHKQGVHLSPPLHIAFLEGIPELFHHLLHAGSSSGSKRTKKRVVGAALIANTVWDRVVHG